VTAFLQSRTSSTVPFVPKPPAKAGKETYKQAEFGSAASSYERGGSRGVCLLASRLGLIPSLLLLDCERTNPNLCATAGNFFGHGSNAAACNTQPKGDGNDSWPGNSAASDRRAESLGFSAEIKEPAELPRERQTNRSLCPRQQDLAAHVPPALYQPDWRRVGCCWRRKDAIIKSFKWITFSSLLSFGTGKVALNS